MPKIKDLLPELQAKANKKYSSVAEGPARLLNISKLEQVFTAAADLLRSTQHHAEICFYKFELGSDAGKKIAAALLELQQTAEREKRKIHVRILINQRGRIATCLYRANTKSGLEDLSERLNSAFFTLDIAFHTALAFGSYHTKQILVDNRYLMLCSGDPSAGNNSTRDQLETAIQIESPLLTQAANQEFNTIWQKYGSSTTAETTAQSESLPLISEDLPDTLYLSCQATGCPGNNGLAPYKVTLLAAINRAQSCIYLITPNLNDPDIINALANAANRGVKVLMLMGKHHNATFETLWGGSNIKSMKLLDSKLLPEARKNFCLRWALNPTTHQPVKHSEPNGIHAKFCCIDNELLLMGSSPLDKQSTHNSREADLVLDITAQQAAEILATIYKPSYAQGCNYYVDLIITILEEQHQRLSKEADAIAKNKCAKLATLLTHLKTPALLPKDVMPYLIAEELNTALEQTRIFKKDVTRSQKALFECMKICQEAIGENPIMEDSREESDEISLLRSGYN